MNKLMTLYEQLVTTLYQQVTKPETYEVDVRTCKYRCDKCGMWFQGRVTCPWHDASQQ